MRNSDKFCFFLIPEFILGGIPMTYNIAECTTYIIEKNLLIMDFNLNIHTLTYYLFLGNTIYLIINEYKSKKNTEYLLMVMVMLLKEKTKILMMVI